MTESDRASVPSSPQQESPDASTGHPAPEELVAYRGGGLVPEREAEIRRHLVGCGECAELLFELAALEATPGGAGNEATPFEVEAAWRKLRPRLFGRSRSSWVELGGWAVAAGLLVVVGSLAYELRELRRTAGAYDPNVPRVIAEESSRRGPEDGLPILELGPGQAGLVFLLFDRDPAFTAFRAEFFADDGRSLLARDGLAPSENLLLVPVTAEILPEGSVRVVVYGLRETRRERVEEYVFQVRHR